VLLLGVVAEELLGSQGQLDVLVVVGAVFVDEGGTLALLVLLLSFLDLGDLLFESLV
jgi:hypothetical protein